MSREEIEKELVDTRSTVKEIEKELAEIRRRITELEAPPKPKRGPSVPTPSCLSYSSENKIEKVEGTISMVTKLKGRMELSLSYYNNCSIKVVVFENTGIPTDRLQTGAHISVQGKVSTYNGVVEITPEKSVDIRSPAAQ